MTKRSKNLQFPQRRLDLRKIIFFQTRSIPLQHDTGHFNFSTKRTMIMTI